MSSYKRPHAVDPATPPKQCTFKIVCGFLTCKLLANVTRPTWDGPRKRYIKEWRVYQQYMDDQQKQEQEEQKKFTERLREGANFFNVRQRLRRRRYAVKQGSPPPRRPPCCPHWDKARLRARKARTKDGTERLRVYEPGHVSRLERYEERLRDPTSMEARQKAAREAGRGSTATTSSSRPAELEAEMESMSKRMRDLERRNVQLVEALSEELAGARQDQLEEEHRAERHRVGESPIEGVRSGTKSLGTVALNGRTSTEKFERHESGGPLHLGRT